MSRPDSDIGLDTVDFVRKRLTIDQQWLQPIDRGFRWWLGPLAQTVWAEPLFDDQGILVTRVHIQTDLVADYRAERQQDAGLMALMLYATLSGPVRQATNPRRLGLASCVWVNASNVSWVQQVAAWAASIQAAEAHIMASNLSQLLHASPDFTAHPTSGQRTSLDEMLEIIRVGVRPSGTPPSTFAGPEMTAVLDSLQHPPCVLALGSEDGLSAEFPFHEFTSLLRLSTSEENPRMGSGLLALLAIPAGDNSVKGALELNEREVRTQMGRAPRSHFLGSWAPAQNALTFVSFVPNAMHRPGIMQNLTFGQRNRARWVAEAVFGDDWNTSVPVAAENKRRLMAEFERRTGFRK